MPLRISGKTVENPLHCFFVFMVSMRNCLEKFMHKRQIPLNENERQVWRELRSLAENVKSYEFPIKEVSAGCLVAIHIDQDG